MTLTRRESRRLTALLLPRRPTVSAPASSAGAIKGIWAVESLTLDGNAIPNDPTAGAQLTAFDGSEYVQRQGGNITEEGVYEVAPSKSPKTIDFLIQRKGPDSGKRQLGIYEIDGNTLRVCVVAPGVTKRPKNFDAPGSLVVINRRYKP